MKLIIFYLFWGRSSPWEAGQGPRRSPLANPVTGHLVIVTLLSPKQDHKNLQNLNTSLESSENKQISNKSTKRSRQNEFQINLPKRVGSLKFLPSENVIKGVNFEKILCV